MRRHFLKLMLGLAVATLSLPAFAGQMVNYQPGLIQNALSNGKTVLVDYAADWCSTCARQERVISQLRSENPQYDDAIIFVRVDWDEYRNHEVTTSRNIPRRSTLVLLKGNQELGRIVAGTGRGAIQQLIELGIPATN